MSVFMGLKKLGMALPSDHPDNGPLLKCRSAQIVIKQKTLGNLAVWVVGIVVPSCRRMLWSAVFTSLSCIRQFFIQTKISERQAEKCNKVEITQELHIICIAVVGEAICLHDHV